MAKPAADSRKSPRWIRVIFETPGGAALITMVLGGLIATSLTSLIQARVSERALRMAEASTLMKERGEAAREVYSLTGRAVAHCREVLALAQREFQLNSAMSAGQAQGLSAQRSKVRRDFNEFVREWNKRKGAIHLNFMYYYPTSDFIAPAWITIEKAGSRMIDCSGKARSELDAEACVARFNEFDSATQQLTGLLQDEWQSGRATILGSANSP